MDELDRQLIGLLEQDAHRSTTAIAKQLGVSSSTVRRRIRKLVQSGTLRIVGRPDPFKTGFPLRAVVALDASHQNLQELTQELAKRSEIRWLAATSGRFDVIFIAWFESADKLYNFLTEVGAMEGVRNSETFICLHVEVV
jgi:Lrp/AsnC family transcriptional regulator for asnA, asnC and gidA